MGFLKKLARGAKKIVKKNKGGVGRLLKKVGPGLAMAAVGATAPALIVKAASAAKSMGKKVRGLETPKSLASVVKAAEVRVRKTRTRMPGGAPMPPMPSIGTPSIGMMSSRAVGPHKTLYKSKTKRTRKAPNGAKKKRVMRAPPSAKQLAARAAFAARARKRKAA